MISETLLALVACPRCLLAGEGASRLQVRAEGGLLCCPRCGAVYPQPAEARGAYLDLRPPDGVVGRETRYASDAVAFAGALPYRAVGAPLLGAAVRQRWLRHWLPFAPGRLVLDVGCGDGRFALWNRDRGARIVGLDAAPFFADAARETIDLIQGDVRALPFPDGTFDAAYSIDVMEHLDAPGLARYFAEVARILKPGGRFFLYSNTRERATLWPAIALWGWLSRRLRARGIGDFETDDLRKSDHVKVLATYEELVACTARYGLWVERVRFWNGVFQGLIDNVLIRLGEWLLLQRRGGRPAEPSPAATPLSARQAVSRRPGARRLLRCFTLLMQLDIILFGRLRSGPFFALLHKLDITEDEDVRS